MEMWAGLNSYETESSTKCYKCTKTWKAGNF